jgi:hypothetical protein
LTVPFTHEEIDKVVSDMPTDKTPGPDAFTGLFIKVCWPVIRYDFISYVKNFGKEE